MTTNKFFPCSFLHQRSVYTALLLSFALMLCGGSVTIAQTKKNRHQIIAVNAAEISTGTNSKAIINVTIINGLGGEPLTKGCVLIKGGIIQHVGKMGDVSIPAAAEITDAEGMYLLPGFIDSHFHLDRIKGLPAKFLQHGVTSVRDPGAWIEAYDEERKSGKQIPRLFLTGPHFDMPPPAYPYDAHIVRDNYEAIQQVNALADQGVTAIKIYFRVPPHHLSGR